MFFSIIIPVYNVEQYLRQCIDSILKQSYNSKEILLINDGSTDNSGAICDEYANKYECVHVLHRKNGGVSKARNCGINRSKGKYLIFVDGDDYWSSDILTSLKNEIDSNNEPDLVFVHNEYHEINGNKLNLIQRNFSIDDFNSRDGNSTLEYLLTNTKENLFSVWRGIFKKEVVDKHNIYFEENITVGEDADWLFRFIMASRKSILFNIPFYVYRINRIGSAISTKSKQALSSYLYIVNKWIENNHTKPSHIGKLICIKLSNNYVENFKYIFFHEENYRIDLVAEIKKTNLLSYVNTPFAIKIRDKINKKGFERVLNNLNEKLILRQRVKKILIKICIK